MNDTFNTANIVNETLVENTLNLSSTFNNIYVLLQLLLFIIVIIFLFNYLRLTFKLKG